MNIQLAKEEIKNTLKAYLQKDESGAYIMEPQLQRPLLLMGPPGIGKTQIVSQVAKEMSMGLVSYTITHHTRQSAVGLPSIESVKYGEDTFSITRYTMSEIIASVYETMERTGQKEGILFIDEINCVSETLTPAMLSFLQNKTFGNWKVPEGWIIVAAGNPPEYNKSVRDYDMVTLDRVRYINIKEDLLTWLKYANESKVHGAILAYLDVHPDDFYRVQMTVDGLSFVTARGWQDLSSLLYAYENIGVNITSEIIYEYLRFEEISDRFFDFYMLYEKYKGEYDVAAVLTKTEDTALHQMLLSASADERIAVCGLLLDNLLKDISSEKVTNAFEFIEDTFSEGQEMLIFTTRLTLKPEAALFLALNPNEKYLQYSAKYLGDERKGQLLKEIG